MQVIEGFTLVLRFHDRSALLQEHLKAGYGFLQTPTLKFLQGHVQLLLKHKLTISGLIHNPSLLAGGS